MLVTIQILVVDVVNISYGWVTKIWRRYLVVWWSCFEFPVLPCGNPSKRRINLSSSKYHCKMSTPKDISSGTLESMTNISHPGEYENPYRPVFSRCVYY